MTFKRILSIFVYIFLDCDTKVLPVIFSLLFILGLSRIFKKCGANPKHAFIPVYRYYVLAKCADCEIPGRIWYSLCLINLMLNVSGVIFSFSTTETLTHTLLLALPMALIRGLYSIQIYLGLIDIFKSHNLWLILWLTVPSIPSTIWGYSNSFQPKMRLADIQEQKELILSGRQAVVMDAGLTLNLEDRIVRDFFSKKYLLRDIHMYIKPGNMVLLLGGSGAGKSTLLNAITGYEKANAEVVLNGVNIYSEYQKMQYEIGFVPQQDLMRPKDTVFNTLMDAAALRLPHDFSKEDRRKRVTEVMTMFGLAPVQRSLVEKLSGGQRKRLSIAMEFIPNPSLFILDEPDSGLDGVMARELMEQLKKIAELGKIVVVITHTPDRVIDLFDDVIVLAKDARNTGRLAFFGTIEESKVFFATDSMEKIVMQINSKEEGGENRADEYINKYAEVQHG